MDRSTLELALRFSLQPVLRALARQGISITFIAIDRSSVRPDGECYALCATSDPRGPAMMASHFDQASRLLKEGRGYTLNTDTKEQS